MPEYTKEQFWKLYKELSPELQEAIFSEETANDIYDICQRNGIKDDRISTVARYTGRVLLGVLPPEDIQATIKKEAKLDTDTAKKISQEINRFVFYPVRTKIAGLYKKEVSTPAEVSPETKSKQKAEKILPKEKLTKNEEELASEKEPPEPKKEDVYREPIE